VASLLLMVVRPFFTCICRSQSSWDSFSSGKACRKTGANAEATTLEGGKLVIAQRPVGFAGSHQNSGDQWRGLLQCQFGASLREPE
jgi:hypothetical protein